MNNPSYAAQAVIAVADDAVYVQLSGDVRRPIDGGCSCDYCKSHPRETPSWDTLVVPTKPEARGTGVSTFTHTVHAPDVSDLRRGLRKAGKLVWPGKK